MPTLYGAPISPFVRKTMVALAEKGVTYEHDPVVPAIAPAEFKRISKEISPLGKIPAYRDGDLTLPDSSVIIAYLERVQPSPALYPSDPRDYARALWFEEYGDGGLSPIVGPKIFFQKIAGPAFFKTPTDEAVVNKAINEELPPLFDYLEGQLGTGDWLVGRSFSSPISVSRPSSPRQGWPACLQTPSAGPSLRHMSNARLRARPSRMRLAKPRRCWA